MGKWSLPIIFSSAAFLFTFLSSIGNNTWMTSFVRSVLGFIVFFLIMLPIAWILLQIPKKKTEDKKGKDGVGLKVNAETPEEDLLKQMGSSRPEQSSFTPLSPPIVKKKAANDPEEIANAIRVLSNQ
ncbi:hypothetical protein U6S72_12220 [Cutibacterium acnes]